MSNDKKDLTRIEDLGEYLHELNAEDDFQPSDEFSGDLPDIPSEETSFDAPPEFESTPEPEAEAPAFENAVTEEEPATDLGSTFESSEFSTSFEETPTEESASFETDATFETDSSFETSDFNTAPEENTAAPETTFAQADEDLFASEPEAEPELEPIEEPVYTPPQEETYKAPENFEDIKKFSESSSFSGMATEGNPSFSVMIKNVRFVEDVNDIVSLLREFNLLIDGEDQVKGRLMRGTLLVPRISEFAAVLLAHKLRKFDIDIQVGLSDEIHPPKHQEAPETGIVSKHNLYQNQTHHFHFDDPKLEISQIIVSATSNLEGYQVVRYLGVASEHKMLDAQMVEDENSSEIPAHYSELAQKLKAHALKVHSNAVVGLNYQLTPIPSEYGMSGHKYRLTCTGNLVWVNKL